MRVACDRVVGCGLQVACCGLRVACCVLADATRHLPLTTRHSQRVTRNPQLGTRGPQRETRNSKLITRNSSLIHRTGAGPARIAAGTAGTGRGRRSRPGPTDGRGKDRKQLLQALTAAFRTGGLLAAPNELLELPRAGLADVLEHRHSALQAPIVRHRCVSAFQLEILRVR